MVAGTGVAGESASFWVDSGMGAGTGVAEESASFLVDSGMGDRSEGGGTLAIGFFDDGVGGFFLVGVSPSDSKIVASLVALRVPLRFATDAGLGATPLRFPADAGLVVASVKEGM